MPRPFKTDRGKEVVITFPESVHNKLQAALFSELEGKVPYGARSALVTELVREWLKGRGVIV